jgi:hypothetical protein
MISASTMFRMKRTAGADPDINETGASLAKRHRESEQASSKARRQS